MLLVGLVSWWYGAGWRGQVARIAQNLAGVSDFFSVPLLLKTFFAPWRQISADETGRSLGDQLRASGDKLFSRAIGAFLRFFMIIFGALAMFLLLIFSLIRLIIWPILPLLPVAGFVLMFAIGAPWKLI